MTSHSMSFISHTTVRGLRCSHSTCTETVQGPEMDRWGGEDYYRKLALRKGWTLWRSRSTYAFCPDHKPTPRKGSRMTELAS